MKNKKDQIKKIYSNQLLSNENDIKNYDGKISLFAMCSKKYKNMMSVIYTLGTSIAFAVIYNLTGKVILSEYTPIICLTTSITLGSAITIVKTRKYKKSLSNFSFARTSKQIDEEMIRYCVEKDKLVEQNEVLKKISNDSDLYFISNEEDYRSTEELLNSISRQKETIDSKEKQLDIISSKKSINKNIGYNKIKRYTMTTLLSLLGTFSVCYLPSIGLSSNEMIIECIKISVLFNIPMNIVYIKNLIGDNKLYKKINNEIEKENSKYKLQLTEVNMENMYKKLLNELYASKIQITSDELELSSRRESNITYQDNSSLNNTKEKNKTLVLKNNFKN